MVNTNVTIQQPDTPKASDSCTLSPIDASLYGFAGGLLLSGLILMCFILFGQAITGQKTRNVDPSASSNTRADRPLGKKKNRGPPPSSNLRPIDVNKLALSKDAPDDIRAAAIKIAAMKHSLPVATKSNDRDLRTTMKTGGSV